MAALMWLATVEKTIPLVDNLWDKLKHFAAFGVLALFADFAFPERRLWPAKVLAVLAYGVLIELVQAFLPHRSASALDVLADAVGIATYVVWVPLIDRLGPLARLRRAPVSPLSA